MSLIPADNGFAILAVFFALAAIGTALEKTRFGQRVSGAMIVIAISVALANLRIIPTSAPSYGVIWVYLVPMAIALFLIKADLLSIVVEGGRTIVAFLFGAVGVVAGAWLGVELLDLGRYEAEFAAVFSATYTGGSLNFAAVAEAIGFRDATNLAAGVAIDNVVGLGYFLLLGSIASWPAFSSRFPWRAGALAGGSADAPAGVARAPTIVDLGVALGLAALACAAGFAVAEAMGLADYGILFVTVLMVVAATLGRRWLQPIAGTEVLAMLFMYLFFALLGAGANIAAMLDAAPVLFGYVLIIFAVHIVFILAGARLCRLNHAEIVIASTACIGGPSIAVAFAVLLGWRQLAIPAVAAGVLGYVVGNFIGIGVFELVG